MNRSDQDPHDWLTAQFSDDDDFDDDNAGTDAADADAADQAAPTSPEPAASSPVASEAEPPTIDAAPALGASDPAAGAASESDAAAPEPAAGAAASIVSAEEPRLRETSAGSTTAASFAWGLRPTGRPSVPVEPPSTAAGETPPEREPDPVVPASFSPAPKAERTANAANPAATGSASEPSAASAAAAPVSAAGSAATAKPARLFYPPPPAISRPAQRDSGPLAGPAAPAQRAAEPAATVQPAAQPDPDQADAGTGSGMSIAEVLDAPSPRRAAREAAAREVAAPTSETRDDTIPARAEADEPQNDGIDGVVDPHAPLTPTFAAVAPQVPGDADPVRTTGAGRFDVPVVHPADGPALVGRTQPAASEASTTASSPRTPKILLIVGILLVMALAIVLIFVLAQRADALTVTGALDAGVFLVDAVGLTRFL